MAAERTEEEVKKLAHLGDKIMKALRCDAGAEGTPCESDQRAAVEFMIEYIKLHGYEVSGTRPAEPRPQGSGG